VTEFDLRSLLGALHEGNVRFVVIGGVAVGAHGFVRATEDLDLVPDPDPANLQRLTEALKALESTLPTVDERPFDPSKDAGVIRRGGNVTAMTRLADSTSCSAPRECRAIRNWRGCGGKRAAGHPGIGCAPSLDCAR